MDLITAVEVAVGAGTFAGGTVSFIWHVAMYVGKLSNHIARHEDQLNSHAGKLGELDDEVRFLKGIRRA